MIVDENGNMLFNISEGKKTPLTHPYNYDPFVIWENEQKAEGSVYSDRMLQWDYEQFNKSVKAVFGDTRQIFTGSTPEQIQELLRLYFEKPDLILCKITQHCNQSTGNPIWRFDYK